MKSGDSRVGRNIREAQLGPEDDRTRSAHPVVVLSYPYWRTRFKRDPAVLHHTIMVNVHALTIVGVAPQEFVGTTLENKPRIFVPLTWLR